MTCVSEAAAIYEMRNRARARHFFRFFRFCSAFDISLGTVVACWSMAVVVTEHRLRLMRRFVKRCVRRDPSRAITSRDLHAAFRTWLLQEREHDPDLPMLGKTTVGVLIDQVIPSDEVRMTDLDVKGKRARTLRVIVGDEEFSRRAPGYGDHGGVLTDGYIYGHRSLCSGCDQAEMHYPTQDTRQLGADATL